VLACERNQKVRFHTVTELVLKLSDAYESKSLILTTNLEFSKWGGIFTDEQMAAAMIDRLVHHGHLLMFGSKSYRMEHALMRHQSPTAGAGRKESP
jgi:DNA replication protein DnaC